MPQKWFYSEQLDNEICEWIADGKTLRDYSRQKGRPPFRVIYEWMKEWPDFSERFAHAREAGHDVIADEILSIVDAQPPTTANGGTDGAYVSWQKNRAWTRMQLLAKWNPRKYGEQKKAVELSGPNGSPISIQAAVVDGSTLDEETRRAFVEALEAASMVATGEDRPYVDEEDLNEGDE